MIGQLTGICATVEAKMAILNVGGVGYRLALTPDSLAELKTRGDQELTLWTYLAVRENALDLYGFLNQDELGLFELLITVPSIGPKTALGVLSLVTPATLRQAITSGNAEHLVRVGGLGRKSAEKIVHALADKLGQISTDEATPEQQTASDVAEALRALGYSSEQVRRALKSLPNNLSDPGERVRAALKSLGQKS